MARTPHLRVPLTMDGPALAVVEQDSPQDIEQCIGAVLKTEVGSRIDEPTFGRPDETFHQALSAPSAEVYLTAVAEWEPRSRVLGEAELEGLAERITIRPEES